MTGKPKHSWEEISARYITGDMSLNELADSEGVNVKTLYSHSSDENWAQKREKYRKKLLTDKIDKAKGDALNDKSEFDTKTDRAVDAALSIVAAKLVEAESNKKVKINSRDLKGMIDTVRVAQEIKYRRHDIPLPKLPIELDKKNVFEKFQESLAKNITEGDGNGEVDVASLTPMVIVSPELKEN